MDRSGARPLREQLEQQLRDGIRRGVLHAGTPLPSTRALAAELGISRGVVVEAYAQLAAEGFLVSRAGAVTRVAHVERHEPSPPAVPGPPRSVRFDFRVEAADLSAFPRRAWLAALRDALHDAPDAALGYGDRAGVPALRATLAAYLGRARGVAAEPERIVVCTGMTQAVAVLARALRRSGVGRVGVEDPGFPVHRRVLAREGLAVVPVPVDRDGLVVQALEGADVGAVLITPSHQYPLGMALAPERRAGVVEWAVRRGAWILEDDYDGEYRFDREPVGALQALAPGHVVYLGTASKTLAPGLRLGWAVLPEGLAEAVTEAKALADSGSPQIDQLALARFIERGDLDRHLRRMRGRYRRRRDLLVGALERHLPAVVVEGLPAGLHVTARLPGAWALGPLLARAWERGVGLHGFEHGGVSRLMLGYANIPEASVAGGVRALAGIATGSGAPATS
ncbi:MocR-like pyridoxine biosynthesis transcription factor PdxR [Baekduia soli]|uniref:MocR-like pyridoxine biosynthesis transcription factor PdxR n=1 Tax=Baekduia soli TaxID=496014 RepID=UPI001E5E99FB|nr:PLP-dependent aminotransferase family protein [Baekduia soli]